MVTFRQVVRTSISISRQVERDKKRRAREAAQLYKEQLKNQIISENTSAVQKYEAYINVLKSVHKNSSSVVNWEECKKELPPEKPERNKLHEKEAQSNFDSFTPNFFQKLLGSGQKKIGELEIAIRIAKNQDEKVYKESLKEYEENLVEWKKIQSFADGILKKNPETYLEIINFFDPFEDIGTIGSKISFSFESDTANVELFVANSEVIPTFIIAQTKTGKLSKKDMPISKFNELYQDYVCSCVLRVAAEILAYIPLKMVAVHAMAEMLNSSTGHFEVSPIVSIAIPPESLYKLNMETIDPSDSLNNFVHKMKFSKTNGFVPVEKVNIKQLTVN